MDSAAPEPPAAAAPHVAQGAVAEFRLDQEGIYPFVTHDFTNAAKGAVGLLRTENPEGTMSH